MSDLPSDPAGVAGQIESQCGLAERFAAEAAEDYRLDRRTLTSHPDHERLLPGLREEIERALLAAVRLGAPRPEAEQRFDELFLVCQSLLTWVPTFHKVGNPPGTGAALLPIG